MSGKNKKKYIRRIKTMTIADFQKQFATDEQCYQHLRKKRWPDGFVCSRCQGKEYYYQRSRRLYHCRACGYQASLIARTVFHHTHLPLWKWFWAIYRLSLDKKGLSAIQLTKEVDISYPSAWLMLHKLREAMRKRDKRYLLGGVLEFDDAYVGGEQEGKRGRGAEGKAPIAVAVEEHIDGEGTTKPGYAAMEVLQSISGKEINQFATDHIEPGSTIKTDGLAAYRGLEHKGYHHERIVTGGGQAAGKLFPWVHVTIGNFKRFLLGTHHKASSKHLGRYLAEFTYRLNRRYHEGDLFEHLIQAVLEFKAITYRELIVQS
jgi:transposase-like protein